MSVQWGHSFMACWLQLRYWHYRKSRGSSNHVLCTVPTTSNLHQGWRKPFPAWDNHHQHWYCCYAGRACQENAAEKTPYIHNASYKGQNISLHIQFLQSHQVMWLRRGRGWFAPWLWSPRKGQPQFVQQSVIGCHWSLQPVAEMHH